MCVVCLALCLINVVQQVGFVHAHLMANGENCNMHTYNTYILHTLLGNLQPCTVIMGCAGSLYTCSYTNGAIRTLLGVDFSITARAMLSRLKNLDVVIVLNWSGFSQVLKCWSSSSVLNPLSMALLTGF